MKVGINARILSAPMLRGWTRYTVNLLAELPSLGVDLLLYTDRPLNESYLNRLPRNSYQVRLAPKMRYGIWEQHWLRRQSAADGVDVLHSPFNFGLPWSSACPRVLTLHDAFGQFGKPVSQAFSRESVQNRLHHWISRTRAHGVITVSNYSKQDLIRHLDIDAGRISVIYEAADPRFRERVAEDRRARIRGRNALQRPYIFYVGGWEERKNIPFLINAFADADLRDVELVLAGGSEEQRTDLLRLARSRRIEDRVRFLGWVEDEDLPILYSEALCFVYPSTYEGFGLQLCEAMAVGCPTLAARATCLPEILGKGGETFSLASPAELTSLLNRLVADPLYRADLAQRAKQRSDDFSWSRAARHTTAVYQQVLEAH